MINGENERKEKKTHDTRTQIHSLPHTYTHTYRPSAYGHAHTQTQPGHKWHKHTLRIVLYRKRISEACSVTITRRRV